MPFRMATHSGFSLSGAFHARGVAVRHVNIDTTRNRANTCKLLQFVTCNLCYGFDTLKITTMYAMPCIKDRFSVLLFTHCLCVLQLFASRGIGRLTRFALPASTSLMSGAIFRAKPKTTTAASSDHSQPASRQSAKRRPAASLRGQPLATSPSPSLPFPLPLATPDVEVSQTSVSTSDSWEKEVCTHSVKSMSVGLHNRVCASHQYLVKCLGSHFFARPRSIPVR